jgi:putative hemolysin
MANASRDDLLCKVKVTFEGELGRRLQAEAGEPFERVLRFHRRFGFTVDTPATTLDARGLSVLNIAHEASDENLAKIPKSGPVVVVANHPFGGIEGLVLSNVLRTVRPDVKIVADRLLEHMPDAAAFIQKNPLKLRRDRLRPIVQCIRWVRDGGMLVVFPARNISQLDLKRRQVADPRWRSSVARIIRKTQAPVLPVFFRGCHGALFQIMGLIHYRLSAAVLPRELLSCHNKRIEIRIGSLIPFERLARFNDPRAMTRYLRMRTYILDHNTGKATRPKPQPPFEDGCEAEEIADPQDPAVLAREIADLPDACRLMVSGDLAVFVAKAAQAPHVMAEIGRLREITFRGVNEGTGKSIDVDRFDTHYRHLIAWNTRKGELVGAYRMGLTDEILAAHGEAGLYTTTLFEFKPRILSQINPAIELGRSFIREEYQRTYAPLMVLWKGIATFVYRHPQYKLLFGPVSINDQYNSISRQLMIRFLKANNYLRDLARFVKARTPLRFQSIRGIARKQGSELPADVEELSALISDIETDNKGVPILLRQYLRLGGKLLGCNIDPDFSNVLDALILVDLTETDRKILTRYMGKTEFDAFLAYHRKAPKPEGLKH